MTRPTRSLLLVFLALAVLLGLTLAVDYLPPGGFHTPVALAIAMAKASLIGWHFMELRHQSGRVRVFAAAGLAWLFVLFLLTAADYLSRGWTR